MHGQFIEHYVQTSDDLSVLGVLESISDLAIWSITKENAFPGPSCKFVVVFFQYEGIRLAS